MRRFRFALDRLLFGPEVAVRDGEAHLLRWFRRKRREADDCFVPMEEFDKEYRRVFGRRPFWYTWNHFYRDHGSVGLRTRTMYYRKGRR